MKKLLVSLFCVVVLTMGLSAGEKDLVLFPLCLKTINPDVGGPDFQLNLLVNEMKGTVSGYGMVFSTLIPPSTKHFKVYGDITHMPLTNKSYIWLVLTGYPIVKWPPNAGLGPVLLPTVHARIVLDPDWKKGRGNFCLKDKDGKWHNLKNIKVNSFECFKKK